MPMLTQDDLKAIGEIVKGETGPIREGLATLEERMNVKFDAVQESLESIENRMVTKSYLDDKLAHYVKRPF